MISDSNISKALLFKYSKKESQRRGFIHPLSSSSIALGFQTIAASLHFHRNSHTTSVNSLKFQLPHIHNQHFLRRNSLNVKKNDKFIHIGAKSKRLHRRRIAETENPTIEGIRDRYLVGDNLRRSGRSSNVALQNPSWIQPRHASRTACNFHQFSKSSKEEARSRVSAAQFDDR